MPGAIVAAGKLIRSSNCQGDCAIETVTAVDKDGIGFFWRAQSGLKSAKV